jgi:kynureninase
VEEPEQFPDQKFICYVMQFENNLEFAQKLDEQDSLSPFRDRFIIPGKDGKEYIYFLGNSLGLQPKSAQSYIQTVLTNWGQHGVNGFFEGEDPWYYYHDKLAAPLAKIVGALPHEVVVMNQLTVNLHLMMVSFYQPNGKRKKIICEAKAFPSDQYMLETFVKYLGLDPGEIIIEVSPRNGKHTIRIEDILYTIQKYKEETALVFWGGVNYYSGQFFDIAAITKAAHDANAKAGFDLAHAAGNTNLQLHEWDVDFACWCSYKYLNSGPGATGGVYIHEKFHNDPSLNRMAGWWGYDKETRFKMEKGFKPVPTAEGWQLSTPSIISCAIHKAALDIFEEAGLDRLFSKGKLMSNYLFYLLNELNTHSTKFIEIITPSPESERGCQVSILMKENGKQIFEALYAKGIFADWREPNVIRIAPVPLYNTFEEIWKFSETLRRIVSDEW